MRNPPRATRRLALLAPALVVLAGTSGVSPVRGDRESRPHPRGGTAQLRLLGVNDFHGTLESPAAWKRDGRGPVPVGGAAVLASHLRRAARGRPGRTITVHAGDMVGASPLISSHFHDEPSVRAMNLMGFDVGTVGNHEFDEGAGEMLRLLRGGPRRDGRQHKRGRSGRLVDTSSPDFPGAAFPYVAANTVDRRGRLLLSPYRIVERDGVRVGFIGVTTESTPRYLLARHSRPLRFLDISRAVDRYIPALRSRGVHAIVVLAHSGAFERGAKAARGEIVAETRQMSDEVDVVVAGHTHSHLNLRVGNKLVVEALAYGTAYDRVDLTVDRRSGEVVRKDARTPRTWSDEVTPDAKLRHLVGHYAGLIAPVADRVVGRAEGEIVRSGSGSAGLSDLGQLAADAQRALARADIAFVNPGNLRGDIERGRLTYGELFRVQPYEHRVMRVELRGSEIRELLRQQFRPGDEVRLHASGLRGRRLDPDATYTVAANELLVTGDRFTVLRDRGRNPTPVGTDLEALVHRVRSMRRPIG